MNSWQEWPTSFHMCDLMVNAMLPSVFDLHEIVMPFKLFFESNWWRVYTNELPVICLVSPLQVSRL